MGHHISATDLARRLGDILGRIRYRGESFVIERNNTPVARLGPVAPRAGVTVRAAFAAWHAAGAADDALADDLERAGGADRPPRNPWAS